MAFGFHLALDLYDCKKEAVGSLDLCYEFLSELPGRIGMEKQSPPFIFFTDAEKYPDKAGLSGWVPLVESGISVHTLTLTNFVSIDVYSCKEFDIDKVIEFTSEFFGSRDSEKKFFLRGEKYPNSY